MANASTVQYALNAGETSEHLEFRSDLEKYDLSVKRGENWFVDYRGGMSTRAGTKLIAALPDPDSVYRIFPFSVSNAIIDTHVCIFYENKVMFEQDGEIIMNGGSIYTVDTPFTSDQLRDLNFVQDGKSIKITTIAHDKYKLTRNDVDDWELVAEDYVNTTLSSPVITDHEVSAGAASMLFNVTAVDSEGNESIINAPYLVKDAVAYNVTAGSLTLNWDAVPGAAYYYVYRSVISSYSDLTLGEETGYIGKTFSTSFIDENIIPDFTKLPPSGNSPFLPGFIEKISVTAAGSGYTDASTISITDPTGTGFIGYPVIDDTGGVVNVIVIDGGKGYTNPTIVVTDGSGAQFDASIAPLTGMHPRAVSVFQQREILAGSDNLPITLNASRVGNSKDHNVSADDVSASYSFTLDASDLSPILHMTPTQGGLLLFTAKGIWLFSGATSTTGSATTATSYQATPQNYTGSADIPPLRVDNKLLYIESLSAGARLLTYNEFSKIYQGSDISLLSTHLFNSTVLSWAYARSPFKQVLMTKEDGTINALTLVDEQEIWSWTPYTTQGFFEEVCSTSTIEADTLYFVVTRYINGVKTKFLEQQAPRDTSAIENNWAVDCGVSIEPTAGDVLARIVGEELILSSASALVFEVGDVIRINGGKLLITEIVDTLTLGFKEIKAPVPDFLKNEEPYFVAQTDWSLGKPVKEVGGLTHLNGEYVTILADGNVFPQQMVVGGQISLQVPASKIIVGLSYTCTIETHAVTISGQVSQDLKRRPVKVTMALLNTLGLELAASDNKYYKMKERSYEKYGENISSKTRTVQEPLQGSFDYASTISIRQKNPVFATVLGYATHSDFGDT